MYVFYFVHISVVLLGFEIDSGVVSRRFLQCDFIEILSLVSWPLTGQKLFRSLICLIYPTGLLTSHLAKD